MHNKRSSKGIKDSLSMKSSRGASRDQRPGKKLVVMIEDCCMGEGNELFYYGLENASTEGYYFEKGHIKSLPNLFLTV